MPFALRFLGTGPSGGVMGKERSRRRESSALLSSGGRNFLLDVSRDFGEQALWLPPRLSAVFLTHAHRDAAGGLSQLERWLERRGLGRIPLYGHPSTLKRTAPHGAVLKPHPLRAYSTYTLLERPRIVVRALPVRHSIQKGFPTYGYRFTFGLKGQDYTFVYTSDTAGWGRRTARWLRSADLLVLDGATWNRRIASHLEIREAVHKARQLKAKRLILTQIGRSAPPHEILKRKVLKLWNKAETAWDGMKIVVK